MEIYIAGAPLEHTNVDVLAIGLHRFPCNISRLLLSQVKTFALTSLALSSTESKLLNY